MENKSFILPANATFYIDKTHRYMAKCMHDAEIFPTCRTSYTILDHRICEFYNSKRSTYNIKLNCKFLQL